MMASAALERLSDRFSQLAQEGLMDSLSPAPPATSTALLGACLASKRGCRGDGDLDSDRVWKIVHDHESVPFDPKRSPLSLNPERDEHAIAQIEGDLDARGTGYLGH